MRDSRIDSEMRGAIATEGQVGLIDPACSDPWIVTDYFPFHAASIFATSIFFIVIIASNARLAAA